MQEFIEIENNPAELSIDPMKEFENKKLDKEYEEALAVAKANKRELIKWYKNRKKVK